MSLRPPSSTAWSLPGLALLFLLTPGRAMAEDPYDDPDLEMDRGVERDPYADRADARRASREERVPLWFSIGASYEQLPASGTPVLGGMLRLGVPLERIAT